MEREKFGRKPPNFKHGGFAKSTGIYTSEDRQKFETLHADLVAKYRPEGPLQEDTLFDIAHLVFRKQNLDRNRQASVTLRLKQQMEEILERNGSAQTAHRRAVPEECAVASERPRREQARAEGSLLAVLSAGETDVKGLYSTEFRDLARGAMMGTRDPAAIRRFMGRKRFPHRHLKVRRPLPSLCRNCTALLRAPPMRGKAPAP